MQKNLQFKISAALKNIIGSDLISDDHIAIFELVKNSYDAHATKVEVLFYEMKTPNAKIIVKDNGKGMDYDDLVKKWLFVAYSAKKEGTEEESYDYRNKIKVKRAYAGAKGIGRFSCDRLGRNLYLETIKDEQDAKVEVLYTDWDKFEGNIRDEFIDINVIHETIEKSSYGVSNGTVLEITNLKSDWDRGKFLELKAALAKLINPNTRIAEDNFEISLVVPEELEKDSGEVLYVNRVNGLIENLIFDTLELKTTKITSVVSNKECNEIKTSLVEGGKMVYSIVEENPFSNLENVELEIYYLNRSAKVNFSRRMGLQPVEYGHVFIYKNGVRIYPYGDRYEDPLKMDNRKTQGRTRYLGTREVIGYISISDPNEQLRETTSRGDGLLKTREYFQLIDWFYQNLKRVERYIIDIVDWGNFLSNDDFINFNKSFTKGEGEDIESKDVNENILKLVESISSGKNIKSVELAPDILEILSQKSENSVQKSLVDITQAIESGDFDKNEILDRVHKAGLKVEQLKKSKDEAESELLDKLIENEVISEQLEEQVKRGLWQGAIIGTDKERIIGLQHQIFHSSGRINRNIKLLLRELDVTVLSDEIKKKIAVISLESAKISSIANFITKANFNLKATEIKSDIIEFILGYLNEIYISEGKIIDSNLLINIDSDGGKLVMNFVPLEVTTLIDVFISNAEKLKAKTISFILKKIGGRLLMTIHDDNPQPIPKEKFSEVFEFGYTTTNGSGIGLSQARDIVQNLKGEIGVDESEIGKGTTFKITI
ncbi:sensor histidine kinase [Sphingobacterium deserti]|uniref:Putative prophage encoded two-component system histidine kinase n=1 Tax=Sphingobacterium deserti TaxID=1229276 RepID=A0A0B8T067_9SPHI|nr:ATP-binding protein [Sphingobacterium deserti]KGE13797.1 putative prophage encoded two-component system histidine kinase [Sphingobacterium deserti]